VQNPKKPAEKEKGPRVLVVDDEDSLAELLTMALRYAGFEVETAATGPEALAMAEEFHPELIVLDVMLPELDGFGVAERLADQGRRVPIIFLTARDTTEDKIRGLTIGGDDYMTKPFSVEELIARIKTVLRRSGQVEDGGKLSFEGIVLDEDTREVTHDGKAVELTHTEFRLLHYLMSNPRIALTRSQILDHVWEYEFDGDSRVLETYISYLRRKVDPDRRLIHTIRGVGYSLRLPRV
jgi:two-component system, OmpR family, response regulator